MLRFNISAIVCGFFVLVVSGDTLLAQLRNPAAPADGRGRAEVQLDNSRLAQQVEPLAPELENLLSEWARASARIQRLEGEHLRRVYDMTFEVEKMSEGKFYFEFPDKGRIDVSPTEITSSMRKARLDNPGKVQKKKNGQPFDLESDREEKWICDGRSVFSIDEAKKQADVVQLPPDLQGTNIMDSPLPFLFGMPPEKAKRRFQLSFSRAFTPASGYAHLKALPRLPQDAQSWSQAEVILDLRTFLPYAVRLTDPAETKITVFEFRNMEANNRDWLKLIPGVSKARLFEPDLRGYHVNMIGDQQTRISDASGGDGNTILDQPRMTVEVPPSKAPLVPNLAGRPWDQVVKGLEGMGFARKAQTKAILLYKGSKAQNPADVNTVEKQLPAPGTPINDSTNIQLWIYTGP